MTETQLQAAAHIEQAVPFFWVRDIQASRRFFEDGLGFGMAHQWIDGGRLRWCWLARDGVAVMLQEIAGEAAARGGGASPGPSVITIYFICKDAIAMYRELRSRGVAARRPSVKNGMWITEVESPDGHRLFFESATDAREGAELRD
jgi:catechol 2,3-dioxygenase-like lactoylglutathione lyase family enzyme